MSKTLRLLGVGVLCCGLSACASWQESAKFYFGRMFHKDKKTAVAEAPKIPPYVTKQHALPTFTGIEADGAFDITLIQGNEKPYVKLSGYRQMVDAIQPIVTDEMLHIHAKSVPIQDATRVKVEVHMPYVNRIRYTGHATVSGQGIKSALLDIDVDGDGHVDLDGRLAVRNLAADGTAHVKLRGVDSNNLNIHLGDAAVLDIDGKARLRKLDVSGRSVLHMQWIDSPELIVQTRDMAQVKLAGAAKLLRAEAWDRSVIDAKYLRAERAFVKTYNTALAELNVSETQGTLASNESNIYFYNDADLHADFMAHEGSVLDMQYLWLLDNPGADVPKVPYRLTG